MRGRRAVIKRLFDVVVSALLLIALSPLIIAVAILVFAFLGEPLLFRHPRIGIDGKPFSLIKFRTMKNLPEGVDPLPDSDTDRLVPFGTWLRKWSLDELPQLWQVLRGEMSLVGPRPMPLRYLQRYSAYHAQRHSIRPGLTGLASARYRNQCTWTERLDADVWYVHNHSLWLDIKILWESVSTVLLKRGNDGTNSMPDFEGGI